MPRSYTVKLPDGNEYGPVDLATLRSWHNEGRIGPDTWVWPEGSPEWLTLIDVLAGAGQDPAGEETPLRLKEEPREARPAAASRSASRLRPSATPAKGRPIGLILGIAAALVAIGGAVGFVLLAPGMDKRRTGERTLADSLPDRRFVDEALGLSLDLPPGWVLLKPESTFFLAPQARARMAHPESGAFAALLVENLPPGVMDLDAFLDRAVDTRRALVSGHREVGRASQTVSGRPARRLQAGWSEGGAEQVAAVMVTQDSWAYFALAAWGPAKGRSTTQAAVDVLLGGLQVSGALDARVKTAADALQPELPELSRASLELILRDRLGSGAPGEEAGDAAIRAASQGLPAITPDESRELQGIYAQVYEPMPEADRQRLADWQRAVRASRPVVPEEAQALRLLLRDAVAALPEESRVRLQTLNEKAIAAAYALR
jgi:hypothetical protein